MADLTPAERAEAAKRTFRTDRGDYFKPGDAVTAVEHDDSDCGTLKPDGRRYPATVIVAEGAYLQVRYDDESLNGGRPDIYYGEPPYWRAWDGALSWQLQPAGENGDA